MGAWLGQVPIARTGLVGENVASGFHILAEPIGHGGHEFHRCLPGGERDVATNAVIRGEAPAASTAVVDGQILRQIPGLRQCANGAPPKGEITQVVVEGLCGDVIGHRRRKVSYGSRVESPDVQFRIAGFAATEGIDVQERESNEFLGGSGHVVLCGCLVPNECSGMGTRGQLF